MVNTGKLNEAIKTIGFTKGKVADYLGIKRQTLSLKINNKVQFSSKELTVLKDILMLGNDDFCDIFFADNNGSQPCVVKR